MDYTITDGELHYRIRSEPLHYTAPYIEDPSTDEQELEYELEDITNG